MALKAQWDILRNGARFRPGDVVPVEDDREAERLLALGAVVQDETVPVTAPEIADEKKPAKKKK